MRTIFRWISLVLYSLLSLFMIWFGVTYASVREPLWFHAAAVPEHAREAVRPLYFALMNLIGGSSVAFGALALFVTLAAVRKGAAGAATTLTVTLAAAFVVAAITAEELAAATGSPTSWRIMGVLLLATLIAFLAHAAGNARRPR